MRAARTLATFLAGALIAAAVGVLAQQSVIGGGSAGTGSATNEDSGTFQATLTGFTVNPTGTVNYRRVGRLCMLWAQANIRATSNSTSMTMTGIPATCRPSATKTSTPFGMWDSDSGEYLTYGIVTSAGVMDFQSGLLAGGGPIRFQPNSIGSTGQKGLTAGWHTMYNLD